MTAGTDGPRGGAQDGVRTRATVLASLPNGMFRLRTADGRELMAHPAKDLRMAFTRLLPGDLVDIEVSPFDRDKARIRDLFRAGIRRDRRADESTEPIQQREPS